MKEATKNLMHPVRPGNTVELGDYGYFKDGLWFRLGNICTVKGLKCSFHVDNENDIHEEVVSNNGISFTANANVTGNLQGNGFGCRMGTSKTNNFFIRALVEEIHKFNSVDVEVLDQIKRLDKAGKWQSNYCVVVSVVFSPSFIAAFSSGKGNDVQLSASIGPNTCLKDIDASIGIVAGTNKNGFEFVNHLNGKLSPIGFYTITWARDLSHWGKKVVKYAGDDEMPDVELDHEADQESEPMVFNNEK